MALCYLLEEVVGHAASSMLWDARVIEQIGEVRRLEGLEPGSPSDLVNSTLLAIGYGVQVPFVPLECIGYINDLVSSIRVVLSLLVQKVVPEKDVHWHVSAWVVDMEAIELVQHIKDASPPI